MIAALCKKLEGIIKLHDTADREDEIKCGFWKDGEGVTGIDSGENSPVLSFWVFAGHSLGEWLWGKRAAKTK
jgi:hypothetical protein